ncbi:hypothetical protein TEA_006928 [Camellia sinensis var. sinensis]|uniref:Alpha/beta hydrolase fold-3 domain-containing protein n=1 Tax=Camellia sinensis var. sinensis TaxID=542762 RepID=A0A4V3WJE1_CAMSN|nr:hypothetical protein TEA_006928 [Camellia sinensis var. sinensis]
MASTPAEEIVPDFPSFIRVYKDGRVERLKGTDIVPPSTNPDTGVQSKDVVINPETGLSARLYIPNKPDHNKLPILLYFHGGGFAIETAFSPTYHNYLNSLVAEANVVVISVDYRRAPEHPFPVVYDDSWTVVNAGGNKVHNMGMRVGSEGLDRAKLVGMVLIHPYFGSKTFEPGLQEGVGMCKDLMTDRDWYYKEVLEKSGWRGVVEAVEAKREDHVFHLFNPTCDNALAMLKQVASFMNESKA